MTIKLYGIANCDTVKRARTWLAQNGQAHQFVDFKKTGVPPARLDDWLAAIGWDKLLNRQGTTWRKLQDSERDAVADAASARKLMLVQPSCIKRPLVEWDDGRITVGFDSGVWASMPE